MYLLFDIGGTKTRLAITKNGKKLDQVKIFSTPEDFEFGSNLIYEQALVLSQRKKIKTVYGGLAGPLDKTKSKLLNAPNLPTWINKPFKNKLKQKFKVPVYLENDAALAGLGEANYGAGQGYKIIAYLTISTGVGGAKIVNRQIEQNSLGFEPGHQLINYDGKKNSQTLEENISGSYLQTKYKRPAKKIKDQKIWQNEARLLAYGLNNLVVLWSPEIIILGGSLMDSINLSLVKKYLKQTVNIFPDIPDLKKAKKGDLSGLYGALSLIN
ncbi:MAG: ROK family protein|nr:ROK family protein [Candidatus Buchananbacteria bacterium]